MLRFSLPIAVLVGLGGCCSPESLPTDLDAIAADTPRFNRPAASQRLTDAIETISAIDPITDLQGCWGRFDPGDSQGGFATALAFDLDARRARRASAPIGVEFTGLAGAVESAAFQFEEFIIDDMSDNRLYLTFDRFIGWHPFSCQYIDRQSTSRRRTDWIVLIDGDRMTLIVADPEHSIADVIERGSGGLVYLRYDCRTDEVFGSPID